MSDRVYYWHIRAGTPYSSWSTTREFTVLTVAPPGIPTLITPLNGATINNDVQTLIWHSASSSVAYNLVLSTIDTVITDTFYNANCNNGSYTWRVRAKNSIGTWSNFSDTRTFFVNIAVWTRKTDISTRIGGKYVKDGGAMVGVGTNLYAMRGYKSNEFYMFNGVTWITKETIPFGKKPTNLLTYNKKKIGKGGALCYDGAGKIYMTKGNSTRELWAYDIAHDSWIPKPFVPPEKGLKGGTSIAFKNGKVYILAGGRRAGETNFFVYDTIGAGSWTTLNSALMPDGKAYKDGSCITLLRDTIYTLKGGSKTNYFSAYSIAGSNWTTKLPMPLQHPYIRKNKYVKDGGAMTIDGNKIYALKGGGVNEFWSYIPATNSWVPLTDTPPRLHNKSVPKTGASLTFVNNKVYMLKGNNTQEFWQYTPPATISSIQYPIIIVNTQEDLTLKQVQDDRLLNITPNPITNLSAIRFFVPVAGNVTIKLYSVSGKLVETFADDYYNTGSYSLEIGTGKLSIAKGIYVLRYESLNNKTDTKVIKI